MDRRSWQDRIIATVGVWVALAPWIARLVAAKPSMSAVEALYLTFAGLAVVFASVLAFPKHRLRGDWLNLILGTWLIVSPRLLDFGSSRAMASVVVAEGVAVVALAGWSILAAAETPQGVEERLAKAGYEHWHRPLPNSPLWRL